MLRFSVALISLLGLKEVAYGDSAPETVSAGNDKQTKTLDTKAGNVIYRVTTENIVLKPPARRIRGADASELPKDETAEKDNQGQNAENGDNKDDKPVGNITFIIQQQPQEIPQFLPFAGLPGQFMFGSPFGPQALPMELAMGMDDGFDLGGEISVPVRLVTEKSQDEDLPEDLQAQLDAKKVYVYVVEYASEGEVQVSGKVDSSNRLITIEISSEQKVEERTMKQSQKSITRAPEDCVVDQKTLDEALEKPRIVAKNGNRKIFIVYERVEKAADEENETSEETKSN